MTRIWISCSLFLVVCSTGCDDDPVTCFTVYQPGFVVTIIDSLTGEPRSEIATAVVTDGAFVDTLVPYRFGSSGEEAKAGAYERPGTYNLRVTAPGYLEWSQTGLHLTADECHVHTAEIEARLVLDPSNNAPVIAELPDTSIAIGDTLRFRATAEDADGDSLRYGLTVFISWGERDPDLLPSAGIDSRAGDLWFAPRAQDAPKRTLLVIVNDGRQGRDSTLFDVQVVARQPSLELTYEKLPALTPSIPTAAVESGALVVRGKLLGWHGGFVLEGNARFEPDNRCILTLFAHAVGPGQTVGVDLIYTARLTELPQRPFDLIVRHEWPEHAEYNDTVLTQRIDVTR